MLATELHQLSRLEKIKLMETLWSDLATNDTAVDFPAWHAAELDATARRFAEGKEELIDWRDAKRELRQRFQSGDTFSIYSKTSRANFRNGCDCFNLFLSAPRCW
ncbi:MAG: addiction module protein [Verrucomicrobiales bacterium]|jgi:hypothetical protein|nr:addiction module protein [Verrucomicrobiales bacterium]